MIPILKHRARSTVNFQKAFELSAKRTIIIQNARTVQQEHIHNSTNAEMSHLLAADYGKHAECDETKDQTLKLV